MSTDPQKEYSKLFEDAEKAVSGIKNEKFREMAFEKLINHLLVGSSKDGHEPDEEEDEEETVKRKRKKGRTNSKKVTSGSKPKAEGPLSWLRELADEGFFKKPKSSSHIREELETRDHHLTPQDLTAPLRILCNDRKLRRKKMVPDEGGKSVLHWVNW